jgi:hypothetical protein
VIELADSIESNKISHEVRKRMGIQRAIIHVEPCAFENHLSWFWHQYLGRKEEKTTAQKRAEAKEEVQDY